MSTLILSTCLLISGCGASTEEAIQGLQDSLSEQTPLSLPASTATPSTNGPSTGSTPEPQPETTVTMTESSTQNSSQPTSQTPGQTSNTATGSSNAGSTSGTNTNTASGQSTGGGVSSPAIPTVIYFATIQWQAPDQRENGSELYLHEIAGYEIQYRPVGSSAFTVVRVPEDDGSIDQTLTVDMGTHRDLEVLIASYDNEGLYSEYKSITVTSNDPRRNVLVSSIVTN